MKAPAYRSSVKGLELSFSVYLAFPPSSSRSRSSSSSRRSSFSRRNPATETSQARGKHQLAKLEPKESADGWLSSRWRLQFVPFMLALSLRCTHCLHVVMLPLLAHLYMLIDLGVVSLRICRGPPSRLILPSMR